jgi:hypothetical protein
LKEISIPKNNLENYFFTSFDFTPIKNDEFLLGLGDICGNLLILSLNLKDFSFKIVQFLSQCHASIINIIKFYPNFNEQPLFATGAYDGDLKIFEL